MADRIKINTDRLGTDSERIQGYIQAVIREMKAMEQSASVLEAMWEGAGKEAFHKTFVQDINTLQTAVSSMQDIYDYNTNAKKQYELCDRKVADLVAQLKL